MLPEQINSRFQIFTCGSSTINDIKVSERFMKLTRFVSEGNPTILNYEIFSFEYSHIGLRVFHIGWGCGYLLGASAKMKIDL